MKLTISQACGEISRIMRLYHEHPNHPNREKWLTKVGNYAGAVGNLLKDDERTINV